LSITTMPSSWSWSVGWLGAAAAYLALGVAAEVSMQPQIVRAAWIGMELSGWFVIVPLACLVFLTGLVLSLGTPWGLLKHYWVVIALVLTTLSLAVLLFTCQASAPWPASRGQPTTPLPADSAVMSSILRSPHAAVSGALPR
jgi:hypothetical protein